MPQIRVHADFHEDVRVQLLQLLDEAGFVAPTDAARSVGDVARLYFNVRKKLLSARPRRVVRSREVEKIAVTLAPPLSEAIAEIARRSEAGMSLKPFLSTALTRDPQYDDPLLNNWGIHHLHLGGTTPRANGYVPRSDELLFVLAARDELYLIDIHPHRGSFTRQALIEILHTNFPQAIAAYRAEGWSRCKDDERYSDESRARLRALHFNTFVETNDGTLYIPPGGGFVGSGMSAEVVTQADRVLQVSIDTQRDCEARADELAAMIAQGTGRPLRELHLNFRLRRDRAGYEVVETQTKHVFEVE